LGDYTVTYTVTDGAGNTTTVTRLVKVVDRIAPEIQLLGANPVVHTRFTPYVDAGVKLVDNYYSNSDLQGALETNTSGLNVDRPGLYIVTYQVADPSGNRSAKVQRYVEVVEVTALEEKDAAALVSVYPNPNTGVFSVTAKNGQQLKHVKVYDVVGKQIADLTSDTASVVVNLAGYNKGIYLIWVEAADGSSFNTKVVVE